MIQRKTAECFFIVDEVVCNSSDQSSAAASLARERIAFLYALSYNRDVRKSAG